MLWEASEQLQTLPEIKARRDFFPFGEEIYAGIGSRNTNQKYSASADDTRKKFATYQRDEETGLDFAQSRYYSPMQGRFTSPDEFKGGPDELFDFEEDASDNPTFYADLTNPQSLNKYQYTYNNPYKYNDPSGHCPYLPIACPIVIPAGKAIVDTIVAEALFPAATAATLAARDALRRSAEAGISDPSCPSCNSSQRMGQAMMNKNANSGNQSSQAGAGGKVGTSGSASASGGGGKKKPKPTGVTSSGRKTDSKGRPIGPSGRLMQHNTTPSTRKRAIDKTRNKKGASGVVRDNKNRFKGKRVKTHLHPVDKKGNRIEKDKEHIYLPKRNQPPGNP